MRDDDKYYYWDKGENEKLSKNFSTYEFSCTCHRKECVEQKISKELIKILQEIRTVSNSRMKITSGYRCKGKQEDLVKQEVATVVAKTSSHEDGLACDLYPLDMIFVEFYNKYVEPRFNNLGKARSWCHVDVRPKRADGKKRLWYY